MKSESGFSLAIASQPLPTSLIQWNTTEILNVMNLTIMLVLLTLTGGSKISFDTKSILRSLLLERLLETSKALVAGAWTEREKMYHGGSFLKLADDDMDIQNHFLSLKSDFSLSFWILNVHIIICQFQKRSTVIHFLSLSPCSCH